MIDWLLGLFSGIDWSSVLSYLPFVAPVATLATAIVRIQMAKQAVRKDKQQRERIAEERRIAGLTIDEDVRSRLTDLVEWRTKRYLDAELKKRRRLLWWESNRWHVVSLVVAVTVATTLAVVVVQLAVPPAAIGAVSGALAAVATTLGTYAATRGQDKRVSEAVERDMELVNAVGGFDPIVEAVVVENFEQRHRRNLDNRRPPWWRAVVKFLRRLFRRQ